MFYEECTLNEIRAYRNLESEIFDFGEGEMEIEGWYGSEDAYLSMSLPEYYDYPEYYNSINSEDKYKKQKQRLNRYAKKQIDKEKLKKLYPLVNNRDNYLYRCYRGSRSKYLKKLSNKKVRKSKGLSGKSNIYRKVFDYWYKLF